MIKHFNPKWYFQDRLTEIDQQKVEDMFADIYNDGDGFGIPKDWQRLCRVTSTDRKTDGNPIWEDFLNIIAPYQEKFLSEIETYWDSELVCDNVWVNKYTEGDFQEVHNHCHPDYNIAMVYFHRCDGSQFHFFDSSWTEYRSSGLDYIMNVPGDEVSQLEVEQGDIIMFPTNYPHFVSPNMREELRITFAGNFKMQRKPMTIREVTL
tara:strand:- start:7861 stop:8481 length:621 start_codon:yes stop_codon:yes gene_type:complete